MPGSAPGGEGDFSVYVGDLDPNVTDSILLEAFSSKYKSILSANVIVDSITKRSKKFGFVRFGSSEESQKAITEMSGQYLLSSPMKLNVGFKKSSIQQPGASFGGQAYGGYGQNPAPSYPPAYQQYNDPYSSNKQNYNYPAYPQDPYAAPSYQSSYSQYPPQTSGSAPYGVGGAGSYPSAPSGNYDYSQQAPSYPSYGGSGGQQNNSSQSYPPSSAPTYPPSSAPTYPPSSAPAYPPNSAPAYTPSTPLAPETSTSVAPGYNYNYNYPSTGYNNPSQVAPTPQDKTETAIQGPVQAAKEIDYDIIEKEVKPLYDDSTTASVNKEFYQDLMKTKGTVDLLF